MTQREVSYEQIHQKFVDNVIIPNNQSITPVSAIIPTYNRAPQPLGLDANPLAWCLESLLAQENANLAEIIVVDDCSTDNTEAVFEFYAAEAERRRIKPKLIRNNKNRGSAISRNKGVLASESPFIFFGDDDCVFDPRMIAGATITLEKLTEAAAVLHLPIYHRTSKPELVDLKNIGMLDLANGIMTGNYGGFPREYLTDPESFLLDPELKLFRPIEIQNLGGVSLTKKDAFLRVGLFPESFTWRNSYREETYLSMRFTTQGYKLFFTPDPKLASIHFKYGAQEETDTIGLDKTLAYRIKESSIGTVDTGNRVTSEEWFHNVLLSTFVTIHRESPVAAENYAQRMHRKFVVANNFEVTGVGTKIEDMPKRNEIYERAMSDTRTFVKNGHPIEVSTPIHQ